jgi:hypothetical protein
MSAPLLAPPLLLTIRFSHDVPDVDLDIPAPGQTTVVSLKHLLRARLDGNNRNRLRLIYQGNELPNAAALSSVLKQLPPPPPADDEALDPKGKGKAVAGAQPAHRVYVSCSIGVELSPEELDAERDAADKPPEEGAATRGTRPAISTRPRPRGFDRFLQSGFSATEVSTLRAQFSNIQSGYLDPPPSPDTLRALEDEWIDSNAGDLPGAGPAGELGSDYNSILDDMVRGMAVGFFFPLLGTVFFRRDPSTNERFQLFVSAGTMFGVFVGLVQYLTSDF